MVQQLANAVSGANATRHRLSADVVSVAGKLRAGVADNEIDLDGRADPGLVEALSRAAGCLLYTSIETLVRKWQDDVLDLVRNEGRDRRTTAKVAAYGVNGLGVVLMLVTFAPVSYTHLDVYKRQSSLSGWSCCASAKRGWCCLLYTSRCV